MTRHKNLKIERFGTNLGLKGVAEDQLKISFEAEILKIRDYARTRVNFSKASSIYEDWTQEPTIGETEVTGHRLGVSQIFAGRVLVQQA